MNLCLFPRSIVDRKWLELTSLSANGISLFSRFIVDNDSNSLLDWEWVESTSFAPRKWISAFVGAIIDNDPNTLIDRWWVKFASLSWIEFFHFLDLSWTMIGTMGGKRTPEVQNYKKVSRSTENHEEVQKSAFHPLIGVLSSIESELNSLLSVSKWIPSFSRSSVDNDRNTLVDQRWVDFTSLSPDEFSPFLDLPSAMIQKFSVSEGKWNSLLFLQLIFSFSSSNVNDNMKKLADRKWEKFTSLYTNESLFLF